MLDFFYQNIFKPLAFTQDPETVHDRITRIGAWLGGFPAGRQLVKQLCYYQHPSLNQQILGINFPNPIGLSAGFDKNAQLTQILPAIGFGFAEIGSITGEPCPGNPKPRLWRMKNSKSLMVYYGLKNDGAEILAKKLEKLNFTIPIGISVAKTNSPETVEVEKGIQDYVKAFKLTASLGAYTTINISCPNTFGGEPFTDPERLEKLLAETDKISTHKPTFIKFSPDLSQNTLDNLLVTAANHKIAGIIISNLTKNRQNSLIKDAVVPDKGGMSGKIVENLANEMLEYVYKKTQNRFVLIGCGGIFTGDDAYKKIRLGATLVQLITGMIYEGPQVIGKINRRLVELLHKDGLTNIHQAIGLDAK